MSESLRRGLQNALDGQIRSIAPASGGDINDAYRVTLGDGRRLFVKANRAAPVGMFEREAEGLNFLADGLAGTDVVVPEVVIQDEGFLVLELLTTDKPASDCEERLGHGLAALHRAPAPSLGLSADNFIGTLPQENAPRANWAEFYGEQRILAQMELPGASRLLSRLLVRRLHRLIDRLPELVGPFEPPSRLHGDLWGGNWLATNGGPALIDPAVYGGDREVDLAMMKLFGGFSSRVFEAYEEAFPTAPAAEDRIPLYQLYPLLVHVNLFGAGYVSGVENVVNRYI